MPGYRPGPALVSVCVALLLAVVTVGVAAPESHAARSSVVVAHYYPWYQPGFYLPGDPVHPEAHRPGPHQYSALLPALGWYGNQGAPGDVTAEHIRQAKLYSVGAFAVEWKGKGSGEDALIPSFRQTNAGLASPIKWFLTMDSDQWGQDKRHFDAATGDVRFDGPSDPPQDNDAELQMAADIGYACAQYASDPNYLRINGRPVLYLFGYERWTGAGVGPAVWRSQAACEHAIGVKPYLIGDFSVGPAKYAADANRRYFVDKARIVDAVSNYSLFNGYADVPAANDTVLKYGTETTWPHTNGRTRLDQAFVNGGSLADAAGKPYFPGLQPQYFKIRCRVKPEDPVVPRWNDTAPAPRCDSDSASVDPPAGYLPPARWSEPVVDRSRQALTTQFDRLKQMADPALVFVTSWNELIEGTAIEPTVGANGEGYAMFDDFLLRVREYVTGTTAGPGAYPRYVIRRSGTGQTADVSGGVRTANAPVIAWPPTGGENQEWSVVPSPNGGGSLLLARHSNMCLTVAGGASDLRGPLAQEPCRGAPNQVWQLPPIGTPGPVKNAFSALVMTASSGADGSRLATASDTGAPEQKWVVGSP